jgi:hypothetical protein
MKIVLFVLAFELLAVVGLTCFVIGWNAGIQVQYEACTQP